jgi:hypothetical protein
MKKNNVENNEVDIIESLSKDTTNLESITKNNIKSFEELVDSLSSAHDKKKALWKQIYENAVKDRRNSYVMFIDLYSKVHGNGSEHAIHGNTLAKYMERLNKSNEQLLKLAELIDEAVEVDDDALANEDSIYTRLERE